MFVVQVAADIFATKTNFELAFPSRPTILELTRAAETGYSNEIALRRPEGVPPHSFHVAKMKFFDEDRNKWVDLLSEAQLSEFCQVYAFQPETPWHKETQREIPAAVKPPSSATATRAAQPVQQAQPYAQQPSTSNVKSTPAGAAGGASRYPLDATEEEKVRIVFQEFDLKNQRMIDTEDLKQGFRTLGIEFTTATMNDLFQKCDVNSDGRISFSEFERFSKMYPIMVSCLFYRSKAFWDEEAMNREIQAEKDAVRQAGNLVQQAQQAQQQAAEQVETATNDIMNAETDIKDKASRIRDAANSADQAQRDKDRSQKEKYDRENDLVSQRDRERQARTNQQDLARDADKADRRLGAMAAEGAKADDRVKALQQQLQEAQRALDRAQQNHKQAQGEAEGIRARERDAQTAADQIARELPKLEESFRQADNNQQIATERCKELELLQRDLNRETEEAARRRDAAERAAGAARDHESQLASEVDKARRNAEERERQAKARESELQEQQRQRQLVTQNERQLIEQELRLVEQRESLLQKQSKLESDATSFLSGVRQNMANRSSSYSRDPSATSYNRNDSYQRGPSGY